MSRFTEPDLFLKEGLQGIIVDLVLCNKSVLSVCCLIELDDRPSAQQKKSDNLSSLLRLICRQMGIPLIKIKAMCGYQLEEIEAELEQYISSAKVIEITSMAYFTTIACQPTSLAQ